jgi:two-component system phosphate regulon sensor histidine kinase PhoR
VRAALERLGARSRATEGAAEAASASDSGIGWRDVVDALDTPVLVLSGDGAVVHANALARDHFPRARTGLPISLASRDPELLAAIELAAATGVAAMVALHERVPVERRLSVAIAPLGTGGGTRLIVVLRDQTEQDRLAQMRADFVAYASHELRTPLASLKGFVETLQGAARDDPKARERFLELMAEQAGRMSRLIDDLLSLSRVEMNEHVLPRGVVDLNEVATFVVQSLEPVAQAAGCTLRLALAPRPARIAGDREELVQMVQNLLQNAIKYGRTGGAATVAIDDRAGPTVTLSVVDDGAGIAAHHLPRLTERFYRVDPAKSREKGGTGLGLAIVKHIVNRHRGTLSITSEVGQGSTFAVRFPVAAVGEASRPGHEIL